MAISFLTFQVNMLVNIFMICLRKNTASTKVICMVLYRSPDAENARRSSRHNKQTAFSGQKCKSHDDRQVYLGVKLDFKISNTFLSCS